jgi:hypothetical protein
MWIFLPTGLLMPAIVPMDKADAAFTEGKYNLQVRGRLVSHLEDFIKTYMEPGTYHEEIQLNPDMDYNCRFYTTHEAFTKALALAVADIDYEKFKPTAEHLNKDGSKRKDGAKYHSVLNSLWTTITRLAPAGGSWAYSSVGSKYGQRQVGAINEGSERYSSRYLDEIQNSYDPAENPSWWTDQRDSGMDDWDPNKLTEEDVIKSLEGIPLAQWDEHCDEQEWALVRDTWVIAMAEAARPSRRERREARRLLGRSK